MAGFGRSNSLSINTSGSLLYVHIYPRRLHHHHPHARSSVQVLEASLGRILQEPHHHGAGSLGLWGRITHGHANGPPAEINRTRGNRVPVSSAPRLIMHPSPSSRRPGCSAVHPPPKPHSHPSRPASLGTQANPRREPPGGSSVHPPSSRSLSRVQAYLGARWEETQPPRPSRPNRVDYSAASARTRTRTRMLKRSPRSCKSCKGRRIR